MKFSRFYYFPFRSRIIKPDAEIPAIDNKTESREWKKLPELKGLLINSPPCNIAITATHPAAIKNNNHLKVISHSCTI